MEQATLTGTPASRTAFEPAVVRKTGRIQPVNPPVTGRAAVCGLSLVSDSCLPPVGMRTNILLPTEKVLCDSSNTNQRSGPQMSTEYNITETLDVKGASCPMPVVKTKSAIDGLGEGEVLEVIATDPGSMSDIDGWASGTDGVELLDQTEGEDVYTHYVRKTA